MNLESVKAAIKLFEEFYRYAGLKLNKKNQKLFNHDLLSIYQSIHLESNGLTTLLRHWVFGSQ